MYQLFNRMHATNLYVCNIYCLFRLKWVVQMWELDPQYLDQGSMQRNKNSRKSLSLSPPLCVCQCVKHKCIHMHRSVLYSFTLAIDIVKFVIITKNKPYTNNPTLSCFLTKWLFTQLQNPKRKEQMMVFNYAVAACYHHVA